MDQWWIDTEWGRTSPSATLSSTNLTNPGSNEGLHVGILVINLYFEQHVAGECVVRMLSELVATVSSFATKRFRNRIYLIRSSDHLLVGIHIPLPRLPAVIRDCTFIR